MEKINLKNLSDYQNNSIVSQKILDKETGSITFFAFDSGQKLSEHTAPFDALVQIIEGEADIVIDGITNRLKSGEAVIMPANIPHAVFAPNRFKMVLTMIKQGVK